MAVVFGDRISPCNGFDEDLFELEVSVTDIL